MKHFSRTHRQWEHGLPAGKGGWKVLPTVLVEATDSFIFFYLYSFIFIGNKTQKSISEMISDQTVIVAVAELVASSFHNS